MISASLVSILLSVQAGFIVLDLIDSGWRAGGSRRRARARPGLLAAASLGCIWALYFALQGTFAVLMPPVDVLAAALRPPLAAGQTPPPAPGVLWLPLLALGYALVGFWDYWVHRLFHARPLWLLHENHHLPRQVMNGMPGISARPFVSCATFLTAAGALGSLALICRCLLSAPLFEMALQVVPVLVIALGMIGCTTHSSCLRRFGLVNRILRGFLITTPREHVLHHDARLRGNYGNYMTLWDRVFGTYLDPEGRDPGSLETGLPYDQDFIGALTGGKLKLSAPLRERLEIARWCRLGSGNSD